MAGRSSPIICGVLAALALAVSSASAGGQAAPATTWLAETCTHVSSLQHAGDHAAAAASLTTLRASFTTAEADLKALTRVTATPSAVPNGATIAKLLNTANTSEQQRRSARPAAPCRTRATPPPKRAKLHPKASRPQRAVSRRPFSRPSRATPRSSSTSRSIRCRLAASFMASWAPDMSASSTTPSELAPGGSSTNRRGRPALFRRKRGWTLDQGSLAYEAGQDQDRVDSIEEWVTPAANEALHALRPRLKHAVAPISPG